MGYGIGIGRVYNAQADSVSNTFDRALSSVKSTTTASALRRSPGLTRSLYAAHNHLTDQNGDKRNG